MINITITNNAADCLAWFIGHDMYGDTLSDIIVDLTKEWAAREGRTLKDLYVDGSYEEEFGSVS